jgi:proprotein convertase subtilisin/kexin type 5
VQSTSTIPLSFTLTVSSLHTPSTIPTDYTTLTSYTTDSYEISSNANILFTTYCTFPCSTCPASNRSHCLSCYTTVVTPMVYMFNNTCVSVCPSGYYIDTATETCLPCNTPCLSCLNSPDNCTACNSTSDYKYLNKTSTAATCVSECPAYMFEDTSQIPYVCSLCISPCAHCSSLTNCTTCLSPFYYYNYNCLTLCPIDVTVLVNSACIDCSKVCAKCSITPTNCTQCASPYALYNGSCASACPSDMIDIANVCTLCDHTCLTCSIATTNCTSCNTSS